LLSVPEWRLDIICFGFLTVWAGCFPPLTPKIQNNPPASQRELSWTEITGSLDGIFAQKYFDCLEKLENDHVRTGLRLSMRIDFRENGEFPLNKCFLREFRPRDGIPGSLMNSKISNLEDTNHVKKASIKWFATLR